MRTICTLLVTLLALAGCDDFGVIPYDGLSANTQHSLYAVNENITFIISNAGSRTVNLASCCVDVAFFIDRYENGSWVQCGASGIPCLAMCPSVLIILKPQSQIAGGCKLQQQGVYRFRVPYVVAIGQDMGKELPSNQFTVR